MASVPLFWHEQDVFLYTKILLPSIPVCHSGRVSLRNLLPLSANSYLKNGKEEIKSPHRTAYLSRAGKGDRRSI